MTSWKPCIMINRTDLLKHYWNKNMLRLHVLAVLSVPGFPATRTRDYADEDGYAGPFRPIIGNHIEKLQYKQDRQDIVSTDNFILVLLDIFHIGQIVHLQVTTCRRFFN